MSSERHGSAGVVSTRHHTPFRIPLSSKRQLRRYKLLPNAVALFLPLQTSLSLTLPVSTMTSVSFTKAVLKAAPVKACTLTKATRAAKHRTSNVQQSKEMMVWTPINNKCAADWHNPCPWAPTCSLRTAFRAQPSACYYLGHSNSLNVCVRCSSRVSRPCAPWCWYSDHHVRRVRFSVQAACGLGSRPTAIRFNLCIECRLAAGVCSMCSCTPLGAALAALPPRWLPKLSERLRAPLVDMHLQNAPSSQSRAPVRLPSLACTSRNA